MGLWQWDPNPPRYRAVQSAEDFSRNSGYCRFHRRDDVEVMGGSIVATMTGIRLSSTNHRIKVLCRIRPDRREAERCSNRTIETQIAVYGMIAKVAV